MLKKIENIESQERSEMVVKKSFLKGFKFKRYIFILIIVIAVAGIGSSSYYYRQYKILKSNPNFEEQKEAKKIINSLSKLIELPNDETPEIATVLDKSKLSGQDFFKNTQNGDKLVTYIKARKAILYRVSTDKIIEVAPIDMDSSASQSTAQVNASAANSLSNKQPTKNTTSKSGN